MLTNIAPSRSHHFTRRQLIKTLHVPTQLSLPMNQSLAHDIGQRNGMSSLVQCMTNINWPVYEIYSDISSRT